MKFFKKALFVLGAFAILGGVFSSYAFSLYLKKPSEKSLEISLGQPPSTGVFLNIYRTVSSQEQLVSSVPLSVNPDDDKELMVQNLALQKEDKIKATNNTDWYGSATSYSHNISVGCSTSSGLVSNNGDYYAVQNGTYDIYVKFTDSTYTSYVSTYINVDDINVFYLQDTMDQGYSPAVHYWGSNVITSDGDNYWGGGYAGNEGGHGMYAVTIPENATQFNFKHNGKTSQSFTISTLGTSNAFWLNWEEQSGSYTWNP